MRQNVDFYSPFVSSLFKALIAASRPGFTYVSKIGELNLCPLKATISAVVATLSPMSVKAVVRGFPVYLFTVTTNANRTAVTSMTVVRVRWVASQPQIN